MKSAGQPSLHLHLDRSATTAGLEIIARASWGEEKLAEATEIFAWPDLAVEPAGRSVRMVQEERGLRLWHALLPGRIAAKLAELQNRAPRTSCFLRITIGNQLEERPQLEKLPWEILCNPHTRQFVGQSRSLYLVRTAENVIPCPPLASTPPLRILVATASPSDHHSVGAEKEIEDIRRIWRDRAHVFVLRDAVFETFRRKVSEMDRFGGVQIVHFIGHGGTIAGHDETLLLFQKPKGEGSYITAAQVADQLEGLSSLRLVILNACHTFDPPELPGGDPCRSVALELARRGVPAVIGTSHAIGIDLATRFSGHLHLALAQGRSIHEAVVEARLALKSESGDAIDPRTGVFDWATPILYLTAPDGDLLGFAEPDAPKRPLHLGIRSRRDTRRADRFEADHLLDLLPYFEDREPKEGETWEISLAKLWRFLERYCGHILQFKLTIEAHLSLAFAAGYLLHRCGAPIEIDQLTSFSANPEGEPWNPAKLWDFSMVETLERVNSGQGSEDLAVAISVGQNAMAGMEAYCLGIPGKRWTGLHARIEPEVGQASVQGDAHCAALARALVAEATRRRGHRDVHLFGALPVTLAFQLGRLATSLGTVHLYEYDFGGKKGYSPSLTLSPEDQARPRR